MTLDSLRPILNMPDITVRQLAVLLALLDVIEPIRMFNVVLILKAPKAAISRACSGLQRSGLVVCRRSDPHDKRQVYCALTRKGKNLMAMIMP
jgi:DNA-binding MarR family transcriptional regulator